MKQRFLLQAALNGALSVHVGAAAAAPVIKVYESEYCGCCHQRVTD